MTPARFLEQGELDFAEIVAALDEARRGLGDRFTDEVERALHGLSDYPLGGPAINRRARKKRLHSLPYNILRDSRRRDSRARDRPPSPRFA